MNKELRDTVRKLIKNGATPKQVAKVLNWRERTASQYMTALVNSDMRKKNYDTLVNPDSLEQAYKLYAKYIKVLAETYQSDRQEIDNLISSIWERLVLHWDTFDEAQSSRRTWIHNVAQSVCLNYVRDEVLHVPDLVMDSTLEPPEQGEEEVGGSWIESNYTDAMDTPELIVENEQELKTRVNTFTHNEDRVWDLYYWHGLSYDGIAKTLKIGGSRARDLTQQIRKKFEVKYIHRGAYVPLYKNPSSVWNDWSWRSENSKPSKGVVREELNPLYQEMAPATNATEAEIKAAIRAATDSGVN